MNISLAATVNVSGSNADVRYKSGWIQPAENRGDQQTRNHADRHDTEAIARRSCWQSSADPR